MWGTYLHDLDLSRSQVTARIYSSERWKKFRRTWEILRLQVYKKVPGTFSRFMRPKTKLFAVKFRHISEVFTLRGLYKKFWAHYHHFCVHKRSVCREVETDFGSSPLARFTKKFLGALSRFICPKTKLFAVKFRRILKIFSVNAL